MDKSYSAFFYLTQLVLHLLHSLHGQSTRTPENITEIFVPYQVIIIQSVF